MLAYTEVGLVGSHCKHDHVSILSIDAVSLVWDVLSRGTHLAKVGNDLVLTLNQ
jgi:hypothetical protein